MRPWALFLKLEFQKITPKLLCFPIELSLSMYLPIELFLSTYLPIEQLLSTYRSIELLCSL